MGRTEYLVSEIRSLGRALGCRASVEGGAESLAAPAELSKILAELESMSGNDHAEVMQRLYAKFAEYFQSTRLDSARKDEYLTEIRTKPVRDSLVTAILFKLSFPEDSEALYTAVLGNAPEYHLPTHALDSYGFSWFLPERSERSLSVLDATIPRDKGSESTLGLEYRLSALTSRRSAEAQDSWDCGITADIVRRMNNIRPSINGPEGICSGEEISAAHATGKINVLASESCRSIDLGDTHLRPRARLMAFNHLARQAITKTAWKTPYSASLARAKTGKSKFSPIDFERVGMRERVMELWRRALEEQVPLNARDVLDSLLDRKRLETELWDDFVKLARTYGLRSEFESKITARSVRDNFIFSLNFHLADSLATGLPKSLFMETPPARIKGILELASAKLDRIMMLMREGYTVRKVGLPQKIKLTQRADITI